MLPADSGQILDGGHNLQVVGGQGTLGALSSTDGFNGSENTHSERYMSSRLGKGTPGLESRIPRSWKGKRSWESETRVLFLPRTKKGSLYCACSMTN